MTELPGAADDPPIAERELASRPLATRYEMTSGISKAWLGRGLTSDRIEAFDDAWELFLAEEGWRDWVEQNVDPEAPFLYLEVTDGSIGRRLFRTRSGVTMRIPASEITEIDDPDELVHKYVTLVAEIFGRWSEGCGCPPPPTHPG